MAGVAMSVLKSTSQQLGSLLVEEARFLYGVNDKLEKLKLDLEWLQCFMQDADKQQHESQLIRIWISQIKDFAYEAEDIIDKYMVRVTHPREAGIWNTLKWASCGIGDAKELHAIGSDITSLSLRMSDLSSRLQLCGVKAIAKDNLHITSARLVDPRRSNSSIRENDITIGLEEDANTIVHQLHNPGTNIVVISGMGGLGKTTLARKVFNEHTLRGKFHARIWIFLSQEFQVIDIYKEILRKLWGDEKRKLIEELGDEELSDKIREALQEKCYLLVLDDIWNKTSWDLLKSALSLPSNSISKLLLTTRNHELQAHVDINGYQHILEHLSPENSWILLKAIVSQGEYDIDCEMKKLGEMMLKQIQYLTIATVIIGGILKSMSTKDEWKGILDNLHSIFTITTEGMRVLKVLEMSYNELPLYLRPCFLYLSSFPEDYEISAKRLYRMWEAEGLVSPLSNVQVANFQRVSTLQDIAELYLEELVSRSIVQVERRSDEGKINSCRMHDLVRDMCIQKAIEEGYFSIISSVINHEEKPSSSASVPACNTRFHRLAVHVNKSDENPSAALKKAIRNAKHLRSVLYFSLTRREVEEELVEFFIKKRRKPLRKWFLHRYGYYLPNHLLKSLTEYCFLLRVIDLKGAKLFMLPKQIQNLVHLKYLSLNGTGLRELPGFIVKLQYLQTMDLRVAWLFKGMKIPNILWKLRRLRHLFLPFNYIVRKPLSLHTLGHLETLKNFDWKLCRVEDLLELKSLRRLALSHVSRFEELESLKFILGLSNIASGLLAKPMTIRIKGELLNEESVDQLLHLQGYKLSVGGLDVEGKISMSLQAVQILFWNLTSLALVWTKFEIDPMPVLERLPKLSKLTLGWNIFLEEKMICYTGRFPYLIYLKLRFLLNLKEWIVEEGAMPKLQRVEIYNCPKLKQLNGTLPDTVEIKVQHWGGVRYYQNNFDYDWLPLRLRRHCLGAFFLGLFCLRVLANK